MKKVWATVLASAMTVALVGCGGSTTSSTTTTSESKADSASSVTVSSESAAASEAVSSAAESAVSGETAVVSLPESIAEAVESEASELVESAAGDVEDTVSTVEEELEEELSKAESAVEEAESTIAEEPTQSEVESAAAEVESELEALEEEAESTVESIAESVAEEPESTVESVAESVAEEPESEAESVAESVAEEPESEEESVAESVAEEPESEAESVAESVAEEPESTVESAAESVAEEVEYADPIDLLDGEPMTYAEYVDADIDTPVVVETYVQAKTSLWEGKTTLYTQNEDGAFFVYDLEVGEAGDDESAAESLVESVAEDPEESAYDALAEGTKIKVAGYKSEWSGEVEITEAVYEIEDDGDTFIAEPVDVTDLLGTDKLEDYMNQKVSFKGLTVAASEDADGNEVPFLYNYDGSGERGNDVYFNVTDGVNTYTFLVRAYVTDENTDVYKTAESLEIGDTLDMEGFLYWYEGVNPHITSITVTGSAAESSVAEDAEA